MDYQTLLANAPTHDSQEFIGYLRKNNYVIFEDEFFLVIENCKYHKAQRVWYTAFAKSSVIYLSNAFQARFEPFTWLKKSPKKQTVQRFHIHLYEENDSL